MSEQAFQKRETAWCPGCGNFAILQGLKQSLEGLDLAPKDVLLVGGIGQAAKTPQYLIANAFCGLHGRALPAAVAAKIASEKLTVIVNTGDGDSYGEGGNHFLHNIRRNVDITHFAHDNQIYGLTKGQASPTTGKGHVTGAQSDGNINEPIQPLRLALAAGASFVARAFTGDIKQMVSIMQAAIQHRGYALVDILQPCVSFNKINTFAYYKERVQPVGDEHDRKDLARAFELAVLGDEKIATGILYQVEKPTFHDQHPSQKKEKSLRERQPDQKALQKILQSLS